MSALPKALEKLIEAFGMLPGVGPRTAERYAFYILQTPQSGAEILSSALLTLHKSIAICPITFMLIDSSQHTQSPLYTDEKRDKTIIAIVENPLDVVAVENTGIFHGTYHVLGGVLSPIDGIGPDDLHIVELEQRVKQDDVRELVLATNASVEGESTALFLHNHFRKRFSQLQISRLARGIPSGIDLEYADQITLSRALLDRRPL